MIFFNFLLGGLLKKYLLDDFFLSSTMVSQIVANAKKGVGGEA